MFRTGAAQCSAGNGTDGSSETFVFVRTILIPLEGVCMQLGTLRSRRVLHSALARLMLHVDHFAETCLMSL